MLVVLVVDDSVDTVDSLAELLSLYGHRVTVALNGEEALERVATEVPDVVLLDMGLPRMDGPTLIKEVRQKQPSLKVIFISGYAEDNFRRRLDMDSDIHFLPKPFSLKQLAGKVKEVMREGSA